MGFVIVSDDACDDCDSSKDDAEGIEEIQRPDERKSFGDDDQMQ